LLPTSSPSRPRRHETPYCTAQQGGRLPAPQLAHLHALLLHRPHKAVHHAPVGHRLPMVRVQRLRPLPARHLYRQRDMLWTCCACRFAWYTAFRSPTEQPEPAPHPPCCTSTPTGPNPANTPKRTQPSGHCPKPTAPAHAGFVPRHIPLAACRCFFFSSYSQTTYYCCHCLYFGHPPSTLAPAASAAPHRRDRQTSARWCLPAPRT